MPVVVALIVLIVLGVWLRKGPRPAAVQTALPQPVKRTAVLQGKMIEQSAATANGAKSIADDAGKVEVEFCGLGKVAFHADYELGPGRYLGELSKPAAQRVYSRSWSWES